MGSNRKLGAINKVHMIGIGGSGMLGIASILLKKGFKVSGSDVLISKDLKNLEKEGLSCTFKSNVYLYKSTRRKKCS